MSEFENELFPSGDDEPQTPAEPTGENLEELEEIMAEMALEDSIEQIGGEIERTTAIFCFDLLMALINPTPRSRRMMVEGILDLTATRIEDRVNEFARGENDPEEVRALFKHTNVAFARAKEEFIEQYGNGMFDSDFLEKCRCAIRKNLSR